MKFDKYNGPKLYAMCYRFSVILTYWKDNENDCSRQQFPLSLAHAVNIRKSHGLTIDKAGVDIGQKETTPTLSYIAVS